MQSAVKYRVELHVNYLFVILVRVSLLPSFPI